MAERKKQKKKKTAVYHSARILTIFLGCICLSVAAIGYTMFTHKHLWTGRSTLNSALRSSVLSEKINGTRGAIYDRTGQLIAQQTDAYNLLANLDTRTEQEKEEEEALLKSQRQEAIENGIAQNRSEQVQAALEAADAAEVERYVQDPEEFAAAIASVLKERVDEKEIVRLINSGIESGKSQISLGPGSFRVSADVKERLESMKIPGLSFGQDVTREYLATPFSSNMLGFAAYDDSTQTLVGKHGLEKSMDIYLAAKNGLKTYQATSGNTILPGSENVIEESSNGESIKLTLDSSLQQTVEEELKKTMETNNAQCAWALVMDPETGKILAWGSYPTFDQNTHDDIPSYVDWISESLIEPGSIIKPLIYSMAIDSGVYPWNEYYRAGSFAYTSDPLTGKITRLADASASSYPPINDAMGTDYGTLTFDEGLAHSSNIAICELLANHLDQERVMDYYDAYRLFSKTGISFVNESAGVANLGTATDYLSTGFGQASSLTMLELAQAYTAVFNDGVMMKPYVVDSIIDSASGQTVQKFKPETSGIPISASAAASVRDLMRHVLDTGMTGERFAIEGVDMALKTGTGEIYNPDTRTYDRTNYTSSVVAAAPADDPKVMVLWGMQSANYLNYSAEPFQNIMNAALKASNVNTGSDQSVTEEFSEWNTYEMPSLVSHSAAYARQKMADKQVNTVVIGEGDAIIAQFPDAGTDINTNDNVLLLTNGMTRSMPDMIGWTRKDAAAFWQLTGLPFTFNGYGRVVWQSIEAGTPLESDTPIEIRLE